MMPSFSEVSENNDGNSEDPKFTWQPIGSNAVLYDGEHGFELPQRRFLYDSGGSRHSPRGP